MKAIIFDVGRTLMEYKNMPNVWTEFYQSSFEYVRSELALNISDADIERSIDILRSYNPKINYREIDYSPEMIFGKATEHWNADFPLDDVIDSFYSSLNLTSYIYEETIPVLKKLKLEGYIIAVLTDVATGMPDELHKSYFEELLPYFDMYVSSISCGYRKPNPKGLNDIAEHFGISPDEMIYIGDEEKDIHAAKRFGCKSVLIDRSKTGMYFGQDFTVSNLNELFDVLKKENKNERLFRKRTQ